MKDTITMPIFAIGLLSFGVGLIVIRSMYAGRMHWQVRLHWNALLWNGHAVLWGRLP